MILLIMIAEYVLSVCAHATRLNRRTYVARPAPTTFMRQDFLTLSDISKLSTDALSEMVRREIESRNPKIPWSETSEITISSDLGQELINTWSWHISHNFLSIDSSAVSTDEPLTYSMHEVYP